MSTRNMARARAEQVSSLVGFSPTSSTFQLLMINVSREQWNTITERISYLWDIRLITNTLLINDSFWIAVSGPENGLWQYMDIPVDGAIAWGHRMNRVSEVADRYDHCFRSNSCWPALKGCDDVWKR